MKRIGFLILCLFCLNTYAQGTDTLYHRVGDTIRGRWPAYFYQWWVDEWINDTNNHQSSIEYPRFLHKVDRLLRYCYTDRPVRIKGIALCSVAGRTSSNINHTPALLFPTFRVDSLSLPEYVYLYDACADSFPLKFEAEWSPRDSCRYIEVIERLELSPPGLQLFCCDSLGFFYHYFPIREYYMEKSITVEDSFYVGFSLNSYYHDIPDHNDYFTGFINPDRYTPEYANLGFLDEVSSHYNNDCLHVNCEPMTPQLYRFINTGVNTSPYTVNQWYWTEFNTSYLIFPIIDFLDSTEVIDSFACQEATAFRVGAIGHGSADLVWYATQDNQYWIVSYGEEGTLPDSGAIDTVHTTYATLTDIDSCKHYVAYLRSVCLHNDSLYVSDWSEGLDIYVCDTTPPDTVNISSIHKESVHLVPNPAKTQVRVIADCQVSLVSVFDSKGTALTSIAPSGNDILLDIKEWPDGVYIVKIHTPQGVIIRKLLKN